MSYDAKTIGIAKAYVNSVAALKADKTYTDNLVASVSASPEGVYATVAALEAAIPAGDDNIYVVTADGHWYFWNSISWTDGGAYQATGLEDGSVSYEKTDFAKVLSNNLYNKDTVLSDFSINQTTGLPLTSSGNYLSEFIPVISSTEYTVSKSVRIGYYNSSYGFISTAFLNNATTTITTPINTKYIRVVATGTSARDTAQVNLGSTLNLFDSYILGLEKSILNNSIGNEKLKNSEFSLDKTNFVKVVSDNVFNKDNAIADFTISSTTGLPSASSGNYLSEFIKIDSTFDYKIFKILRVGYYTGAYEFISTTLYANVDEQLLVIPENSEYVRVVIPSSSLGIAQINEGNILLPYDSYAVDFYYPKHIETNDLSDTYKSTNIFSAKNTTFGKVIRDTGIIENDAGYNFTDYIEVQPDTSYAYYLCTSVAYYTQNKVFISRSFVTITNIITTPINCYFIRVNTQNTNPLRQINEGTKLLTFEKNALQFDEFSGLESLNNLLSKGELDLEDKFMCDVEVDGVYNTDEIYNTYANWQSSMYVDVYSMFDTLMSENSGYITKELLGNDAFSNPIYIYRCTPTLPSITTSRPIKFPTMCVTTGLHGNEKASTLSMYLLLKEMCENWKTNSILEAMRFNINLILIPVYNPSGWNANTRKNGNGVDLNRNFPNGWVFEADTNSEFYGGTAALTETENQLMVTFLENNHIDIFTDFHNNGGTLYEVSIFLWIICSSVPYVGHIGSNIISKLSRKWQKEFEFVPEDYLVGPVTMDANNGMLHTYVNKEIGIKLSNVLEIADRWVQDISGSKFDVNTCKAGTEAIGNWILLLLKELTK